MAQSKSRGSLLDRRRFLRHTWNGVGARLALALVPGQYLFKAHNLGRNPFTLGVDFARQHIGVAAAVP